MPRPQRSDPEDREPSAASHTDEVRGKDPQFAYQYQPESRIRDYLHSKQVGNDKIGYKSVAPWEVVHRHEGSDGEMIETGRRRADDGEEADNVVRQADCILLRIPVAEHAKLLWASDAITDLKEKALTAGEQEQYEKARGGVIPGSQTGVRAGQAGYSARVTYE